MRWGSSGGLGVGDRRGPLHAEQGSLKAQSCEDGAAPTPRPGKGPRRGAAPELSLSSPCILSPTCPTETLSLSLLPMSLSDSKTKRVTLVLDLYGLMYCHFTLISLSNLTLERWPPFKSKRHSL